MDPKGTEESIDHRQMTLDALADVDAGRVIKHQDVEAWVKTLVDRAELATRQPE
ncbi:CopG family transcriptional regulator [Mesorhizobium sp. CU2]|uniref:CopG family transcriptional regulator n=1 Tax=unclassified Mesorhizobium TaxID=325217 RepID=UPI0011292861|nr:MULTISPECIES: CopG family transcriptional regulator [unclassified Mesorhizobium]TPN80837.1 CopG family transcriptional regulator [Mesorhizobium sp. CU3]TPO12521.1 CopG family transcriptional regulator [Mesorhizobium sp. CU2]